MLKAVVSFIEHLDRQIWTLRVALGLKAQDEYYGVIYPIGDYLHEVEYAGYFPLAYINGMKPAEAVAGYLEYA